MKESFEDIFAVGGKTNSLGRSGEVLEIVLSNKKRLNELYRCIFDEDAWIRMRAADTIEKVCRQHPDWLLSYVDKFQSELASNTQSSIQWHLAQIYGQLALTDEQKLKAINWLKNLLSNPRVDWIVAANAMKTLVQFTKDDSASIDGTIALLKVQQKHKSKSVVRRAEKLLIELVSATSR